MFSSLDLILLGFLKQVKVIGNY